MTLHNSSKAGRSGRRGSWFIFPHTRNQAPWPGRTQPLTSPEPLTKTFWWVWRACSARPLLKPAGTYCKGCSSGTECLINSGNLRMRHQSQNPLHPSPTFHRTSFPKCLIVSNVGPRRLATPEDKSWGVEWSAQGHRANAYQTEERRSRERIAGANQKAEIWLPLGLLREITHPCHPSLPSSLLPWGYLSCDFGLWSSAPLRTRDLSSNAALGSHRCLLYFVSWTGPKCTIKMSDCWVTNHPGLSETIPILAWKFLPPGKPLSPKQTGMVYHPPSTH